MEAAFHDHPDLWIKMEMERIAVSHAPPDGMPYAFRFDMGPWPEEIDGHKYVCTKGDHHTGFPEKYFNENGSEALTLD